MKHLGHLNPAQRDEVLTLVNLGHYFEMEGKETLGGEGLIVLVEFNNMRCGILVDAVEEIHRMRWDQIEPPSEYLMSLRAPAWSPRARRT